MINIILKTTSMNKICEMFMLRLILTSFGITLVHAGLTFPLPPLKKLCKDVYELNGTIQDTGYVYYAETFENCWKIHVPDNKVIRLTVKSLELYSKDCYDAYLRVIESNTNESYTFCHNDTNRNTVTALTNVEIKFYYYGGREASYYGPRVISFSIYYTIETRILSLPRKVELSRIQAISLMKGKGAFSWEWRENVVKAVTSLFLADAVNFNRTHLEEELMATQTELKVMSSLQKDHVSTEKLSMFINALLVTCRNPRYFYGHDLVKQLKEQIISSISFVHPISYLALCNAKEPWPSRANKDIKKVLTSDSAFPFSRDIQAFAVMALACSKNNTIYTQNPSLSAAYKNILTSFKKQQLLDGSFGNVYTTSLVTQALISSGEINAEDWKLNNTLTYLIKELNSTDFDYSAV